MIHKYNTFLIYIKSLHAQMKSNKEELRIGFDKLAQKQDSSTAELREEINEVREWQKTLNANQQAELQMVERQRPLKNGVTQEDIDKARTVNIDLTLSMIVISKCDKARGEAVSLIRHNYMNGNRNKLCRAIFDDLWSKREQADHSMEGGTGRYGNFEEEGMAKFKGDFLLFIRHSRPKSSFLNNLKFKAASVIQLGLEDFLANWPTILASLKQKINDLRSKDFKGEYEARRALKKEFDEPARASVKSKSTILSCLQESCPTGDGNLDDLDFHDLIQSSQRSFSNLNFLDDEALESGFDRNADEDEDDENDEDVLQFLDD